MLKYAETTRRWDAGTAGANTYCGVGDPAPDPPAAPARIRSPRGSREETQDPPDFCRQAARGALLTGPRRSSGRLPTERATEHRLPGHPTREGSLGPPREGRQGIYGRIQGRLRPRARGPGVKTRRGGNRRGDVLQAPQGA